MPYTATQLIAAWTAATNGIAPDAPTTATLTAFGTQIGLGTATDTQALTFVMNNADKTTAVANLAYTFFTGKSPTKAGLDYLVDSTVNATDLNDPYYAQFGLENRYINFAANLGVLGEGSLAFAATYGAMTYAAFVASVYEKIVGATYAAAAGINANAAIADIVSRQTALTDIARAAGMITAASTPAQIDIALKAATAGYIMGEGIKADIGAYAAASNNFTFALLSGTPAYNVDLVTTYAALGGGLGFPVVPYMLVPAGTPFRLTTGADTFTGLAGNDTFNASDLQPDGVTKAVVFNATDVLNGGLGTDTLNIISSNGAAFTTAAATVAGIETATVVGDNTVTTNASTWTGLTGLTVTSVGSATVTAPATSTVAVNSTLGTGTVTVDGGSNVTVAATGANANGGVAMSIGATTIPTGTITASVSTTTAGGTAGTITTKGGAAVNITQTATNPFNTTLTHGAVTVTGGASTTSVTVTATPRATASGGVAGVTPGAVTINDVNGGTATANTITTATVSGYATLNITGSALTTLSVANGGGNIIIDNSGIAAPVNKTLGVTVNGLTGGTLDDADIYTTLNVTTTGVNSTLANITFGGVTALTVAGTQVLSMTSSAGMSALTTVTVSGSAGLSGTFTGGTITAINATGTSGAMTITHNSTKATYSGGSGVDNVTIAGDIPTKALTGGGGTADVLVMTAANAATNAAAIAAQATGFERVTLTGATNQTVDLAALGNYTYASTSGGNGLTLSKLTAGGTLALTGAGTAYNVGAENFGGGSDTLNVILTDGSGAGVSFASTGITASGAETVAITTVDTQATPSGAFNGLVTVLGNVATKITVAGNAGLTLTATDTAATTVDASGITLGGFTWTSGALAADAAVKGSATGTNTVDISAATASLVTYTGGTGNDLITINNGKANNLTLGAGNNTVTGGTNNTNVIVTALGGNDTVTLGDGANNVNLGAGTNSFTAGNGNNTYTGGADADTVIVGNGTNSITLGDGANAFTGGSGVDTVLGGAGVDTLTGGGNNDNLTGGGGADIFVVTGATQAANGTDRYLDFDFGTGATSVDAIRVDLTSTTKVFGKASTGITAAVGTEILVLDLTTYANAAAAQTAVQTAFGANDNASEALVIWQLTGGDLQLSAYADSSADATANGTLQTQMVTFVGLTLANAASLINAGDFNIV